MVDTCSPPAPEDCGLSPLNDVLGAASSGGLWVGLAIDGADELVPRLPVGAVPVSSPVCVSSTAIACTSGGISTWDESQLVAMNDGEARVTTDEDAPLSCAICCR